MTRGSRPLETGGQKLKLSQRSHPQKNLWRVGVPRSRRHYFQHFCLKRRIRHGSRRIVPLNIHGFESRAALCRAICRLCHRALYKYVYAYHSSYVQTTYVSLSKRRLRFQFQRKFDAFLCKLLSSRSPTHDVHTRPPGLCPKLCSVRRKSQCPNPSEYNSYI